MLCKSSFHRFFFLKKGGGCHSIHAVFHDRGSLDCDLSGCNQHVGCDFFHAGINSLIHTISVVENTTVNIIIFKNMDSTH